MMFMDDKPLILLVEDDEALRLTLSEVLRRAGYDCAVARSCEEARQLVSEQRFSCCLVDLGLPDGDGLGLLADLAKIDAFMVPIILTGDINPDTIIATMRAGAFDYLCKPVNVTTLNAAIGRGLAHHRLVRERDELVQLLSKERENLTLRVEEATRDIRQYARNCEVVNARLHALLELSRISTDFYTHEILFTKVYEELRKYLPVTHIALCDVSEGIFLCVSSGEDGEPVFISSRGRNGEDDDDSILAVTDPKQLVLKWIRRYTEGERDRPSCLVFPQVFWNRTVCIMGFCLAADYEGDEPNREFLSMCAHFLASEWNQAQLLLHGAHHASLGNIAVELSKSFVQNLTAIRTATDFICETVESPEAAEGLEVISQSVERLSMVTQEFRKLAAMKEDCVVTVSLRQYVEQALDMLSVAIQNRRIVVDTDFQDDCECVLLNGTALARTFLDLISTVMRSVPVGDTITLRLQEPAPEYVVFELCHGGEGSVAPDGGGGESARLSMADPKLQLAQRTAHSCGGKVTLWRDLQGRNTLRITLPRNATQRTVVRDV
jgi:DNA-binding response OmpR family regulator